MILQREKRRMRTRGEVAATLAAEAALESAKAALLALGDETAAAEASPFPRAFRLRNVRSTS